VSDYRELARRRLPRQLFDYVDGGAYEEATMRANVSDLERVLLRQRVMRDVSVREQATEVLGQQLSCPIVLGPVGLTGMMATRAEVQAARAAERAGVAFIESTVSICPIEEVAAATSRPPWFQLYVMRDRAYAEDLMARARAVGSPVLVLTIDLAVVGARHRDIRNGLGMTSNWGKLRRGFDLASRVLSHGWWALLALTLAALVATRDRAAGSWAARWALGSSVGDLAGRRGGATLDGRLSSAGADVGDARRRPRSRRRRRGLQPRRAPARLRASTVRARPEIADAVGGASVLVDGAFQQPDGRRCSRSGPARADRAAWARAVAGVGAAAGAPRAGRDEGRHRRRPGLTGCRSVNELDRSALVGGDGTVDSLLAGE
jgi:L-lactate dehydrogenase (cytochrome)